MPQVIPLLVIAGSALVGTTTAIIIGTIVAVGLTVMTMRNLGGVAKPSNNVATTYQTNPLELTFQADAPRRIVYGEARISGVVSYANISGNGYEYLWLVVVIAANKISGVSQIYFDGVPASTVAPGNYEYWVYDGSQTTADPSLQATFPEYTYDCVLNGCAYAVVKLRYDKEAYKNGRPNIQFDVKGKEVYDPRTGVTKWSNNAALCIADYLRSSDGLQADYDEIDWTTVSTSADISDQKTALMASSLCEGRYSINGVVELTSKTGDVIDQMLASCAGTIVWSEGKYRLFVGASRPEEQRAITVEDLRENPTLQPRVPAEQSFNGVKGVFLDSTKNWTFSDFPPVVGQAYVEEDGGVERFKDLIFNFTTSPMCAQRLSVIFLRRARHEKTITLPCKWTVFNYEVWDVVKLTLPQLGWDEKLFQITDWKMTPPSTNSAGGIDLTLIEYSHSIYDDNMDLKPVDVSPPISVPDVTNARPVPALYATTGISAMEPSTGKPRIRLDWAQSQDVYTVGYEVAYGKYPFTPSATDFILVSGKENYTYMTPALNAGDTYIAYIRTVNSFEKRSSLTQSNVIVAEGAPAKLPPKLTGLTAVNAAGDYVDISWMPSSEIDNNIEKVEIFWGKDQSNISTAVLVSNVALPFTTVRLLRNIEDGYYFARFVNNSGRSGDHSVVYNESRTSSAVIQRMSLNVAEGNSVGLVWVSPTKCVTDSQKLASELGWEVFDMMVPEPVTHVEFYSKNAVYLTPPKTLKVSGSVGLERSPNVPGKLAPSHPEALVSFYDQTENLTGTFTLSRDANVKLGFSYNVQELQGVVFTGLTTVMEMLT